MSKKTKKEFDEGVDKQLREEARRGYSVFPKTIGLEITQGFQAWLMILLDRDDWLKEISEEDKEILEKFLKEITDV